MVVFGGASVTNIGNGININTRQYLFTTYIYSSKNQFSITYHAIHLFYLPILLIITCHYFQPSPINGISVLKKKKCIYISSPTTHTKKREKKTLQFTIYIYIQYFHDIDTDSHKLHFLSVVLNHISWRKCPQSKLS